MINRSVIILAVKYTENTKLEEVLKSEETSNIVKKYKLPCLHCPMAVYEAATLTLGQISSSYGIDLEGLLKELNAVQD